MSDSDGLSVYLTCNILLVSQCFCIVMLPSDSLNFRCAWLNGRGVVAKITPTEIWRSTGICEGERTCIVHGSVCLSDEATESTFARACFLMLMFCFILAALWSSHYDNLND